MRHETCFSSLVIFSRVWIFFIIFWFLKKKFFLSFKKIICFKILFQISFNPLFLPRKNSRTWISHFLYWLIMNIIFYCVIALTHTYWVYKILLYTHIWHKQESTSEEVEEEEEKKNGDCTKEIDWDFVRFALHTQSGTECTLCSLSYVCYMRWASWKHYVLHDVLFPLEINPLKPYIYSCEIISNFFFVQSESLKLIKITEIGWTNKKREGERCATL